MQYFYTKLLLILIQNSLKDPLNYISTVCLFLNSGVLQ